MPSRDPKEVIDVLLVAVSRSIDDLNPPVLSKFVVVHGYSQVEWIETRTLDRRSMMVGLENKHGSDLLKLKFVDCKGRVEQDSKFTAMPVISLCSQRHPAHCKETLADINAPRGHSKMSAASAALDLHTSEGPIELADPGLTLERCGL